MGRNFGERFFQWAIALNVKLDILVAKTSIATGYIASGFWLLAIALVVLTRCTGNNILLS